VALDSLPGVEYWIRNVARHPSSFRLPTATDFVYPDFIAKLNDGRLFVVEYKGGLTAETADTLEKTAIRALWERAMNNRGVYLTATKVSRGRNLRAQIVEAVS
jgi:type III restriction enzyme